MMGEFVTYIGTKIIKAVPRTREQVEQLLGHTIGGKETGDGYLVEYPDGYQSWSPKNVFEAAYRPMCGLTFGLAIEAMKKGLKVARTGWNGKGLWLELQAPDKHSKMTLPYIYLNYPGGSVPDTARGCGVTAASAYPEGARVPWLASQTDVLAEDWEIVE
jgi:hypothetical protein